jgi:hypothetical protein
MIRHLAPLGSLAEKVFKPPPKRKISGIFAKRWNSPHNFPFG